jgi:murein DD-endopeptidase MepM/ murein hydrolase activator NlpD
MLRAQHHPGRIIVGWRLLTPILSVSLLLTGTAASPTTVEAGGSGGWGSIRQQQARAEATMLRADRQIKRLEKQRKQRSGRITRAKRKLDRAIDRRDATRERAGKAGARAEVARETLGRTLRVRPNPSGIQVSDRPKLRKRVRALQAREQHVERKSRVLARKVDRARNRKQQTMRKVSRGRIVARRQARERAEDKLSSRITQMLSLAKQRASSGPASTRRTGFRMPARGTISQDYGCSRSRRGSCRYFHDGIDIATSRGAVVRASADGYVAYVGRNPWDDGKRAYVVIIGHARGYESIYAHLKPVRRVKAGQRVRRGSVVGVVGMTGHTSGPHVHWEVSRAFRTVNPRKAGR